MKINKRQKLVVPFFKVKTGKVFQTNTGDIFIKIVDDLLEIANAVDLSTGYIAKFDNDTSVEILDACLEIK